MLFLNVKGQSETQTWVAGFIFYDDNHYANNGLLYFLIYGIIICFKQ